ncbi:MAG: hypothetical protein EOO28_05445 [Comamonadaceae bacterium]|nr:MAG: hypothetical protein EOO28_05445 [Comamonadaceae bacterium]
MSAFSKRPSISLTSAAPVALRPVHAGDRCHLQLARHDCVQVDSGAFRLVSRHWLAGQWVATARRLETGECYQADVAGWVWLEAMRGDPAAFIHAVAPRPSRVSWLSWRPSFGLRQVA